MLELNGIVKGFGGRTVLDGIDASFQPGTVTAIVGANGSGKSTVLKLLWGELRQDSGSITWNGTIVDPASESWKRLVGAVPDDDALVDGLSIQGHFRLCGGLSGLAPDEVSMRADNLVRLFGLEEAALTTRSADEASRGNRKRLALALALLGEPGIVLMDEPFSGLDAERAAALVTIVRLLAERGRVVAFSCHDEGITRSAADRYVLLNDGKVTSGPIDRLPAQTAHGIDTDGALPWLA
ncbi:MAG TPA: ABC transporter ATP-binding protein [bacterium]|nr:ABC transporter ATP-binding protein [bacterium]